MLLSAARAAAPRAQCILVVDDEPDIREAIQDLLSSSFQRATVLSAESGSRGLAILGDHPVDLIVTDYKMPGMNGVAFIRAAEKLVPGVARVILTAFDRELMRELGSTATRETILQKPVEAELLLQVVQESLAGAAAG